MSALALIYIEHYLEYMSLNKFDRQCQLRSQKESHNVDCSILILTEFTFVQRLDLVFTVSTTLHWWRAHRSRLAGKWFWLL